MKLIKLPTLWTKDPNLEDLGINSGEDNGDVYINPLLIQAVNDTPREGECTIRMNGDVWRILMPIDEVLEILNKQQQL